MGEKRKRDETPVEEDSIVEDVVLEDKHFEVKVLKGKSLAPKKKKKTNGKGQPNKGYGEVQVERLPGSNAEVFYQISPADEWQAIRKYKNFVVKEETFGVDDYVFIRHDENVNDLADDGQGWVGRVLEIRARSASAVYVRIFWLYWQAELPMGKQPYHGQKELIMSDWMQIIDAQTIDGKVDIEMIDERQHSEKPAKDYYWRQNFYHLQNKLGDLKTDDCVCRAPHNPDTLLIQCDHCGKWQHELCVRDEVLRQKWDGLRNGNPDDENHGATTDLPTPHSASDTIAVTTSKATPAKGRKKAGRRPKGKGIRGKLNQASTITHEWDEVLEGILERDEQALKKGDGQDPMANDKLTGKLVVTDKRDKSGKREFLDARCLHCRESFVTPGGEDDTGNEVQADANKEEGDRIEVTS